MVEILEGGGAIEAYERLRDFEFPAGNFTTQIAVLPAELARCLAECDADFRAHAGCGVAQVSIEAAGAEPMRTAVTRWRAIAASARGHLRVLNAPSALRAELLAERKSLRIAQRRRAQVDAATQGEFRPGRNLQPRMLRRGYLMAENAPNRVSPVRDVVDYELLFDCVHCGLCLEACPTYALTRAEMDSPRGRIYLMKSLAEGRLELDSDAVRHLDLCLGCRGCETACPSGVHYGQLIEGARDWIERNHRRPLADRIRRAAISATFPFPSRLRLLLAPLRLAERVGLRPAIDRMLPRAMRDWLDLLLRSKTGPPFPSSGKGVRGLGLPAMDRQSWYIRDASRRCLRRRRI